MISSAPRYLQIVAFLLGPTGGGEGRERRFPGQHRQRKRVHLHFHIMDGATAPRFWEAMGCPM